MHFKKPKKIPTSFKSSSCCVLVSFICQQKEKPHKLLSVLAKPEHDLIL